MAGYFDPRTFLASAGAGRSLASVAKDDVIFAQGDAADSVYYIRRGRVKIQVLSERGKEAVVGILGAGQFCGEECLNDHLTYSATVTAMQHCDITTIRKATMLEALQAEPALAALFTRYLLERNRSVNEDLIDQLLNSSEKRLARLLLRLAGQHGNGGGPQPIAPHISQETLAEMIGTTRSRVSFFMNKFRKAGLISYDRNIEVHPARLSAMLRDGPEILS